ncbi:MAG: hypothetical protein QMD14_06095 [Candidatus Aenigmarchaeota archaeon]|nr:hypothetical protein [Candidatus Aenigmarchaeota archaeon]
MKKRILIDIDVVAVANYYKKDRDYPIAKRFIERVEFGEYELYSAHTLVELVKKWKEMKIKDGVLKFYSDYCYVIPPAEIARRLEERKVRPKVILDQLAKKGVKEEDGILAVVASLFDLVLVTLNRKHLRDKREEINKILKEGGLNEIGILLPNEI